MTFTMKVGLFGKIFSMIKNIIKLFINSLYLRYLKIKGINVGSNIFINGRILFSGTRKVSIGNDVYINSKIKANPIGGNTQCMFKTDMRGNRDWQ